MALEVVLIDDLGEDPPLHVLRHGNPCQVEDRGGDVVHRHVIDAMVRPDPMADDEEDPGAGSLVKSALFVGNEVEVLLPDAKGKEVTEVRRSKDEVLIIELEGKLEAFLVDESCFPKESRAILPRPDRLEAFLYPFAVEVIDAH